MERAKNPPVDPIAELIALREELDQTPGRKIGRKMEELQRTYAIFEGNRTELEGALARFKRDTGSALNLMQIGGDLDGFLRWLDRPLRNYVASIRTLVDHTRRVARKLLSEGSIERKDYDDRVKAVFAAAPLAQFVDRRRNYFLQVEAPATSGSFGFGVADGEQHHIFLPSESLQRWSGWRAPARRYIAQAGDKIDLYDTVSSYSRDVQIFHRWFGKAVHTANRETIAVAQPLADRINELVSKIRPMLEDALGLPPEESPR